MKNVEKNDDDEDVSCVLREEKTGNIAIKVTVKSHDIVFLAVEEKKAMQTPRRVYAQQQ